MPTGIRNAACQSNKDNSNSNSSNNNNLRSQHMCARSIYIYMKLKSFCLPCLINLISQHQSQSFRIVFLRADVTETQTQTEKSVVLFRCQEQPQRVLHPVRILAHIHSHMATGQIVFLINGHKKQYCDVCRRSFQQKLTWPKQWHVEGNQNNCQVLEKSHSDIIKRTWLAAKAITNPNSILRWSSSIIVSATGYQLKVKAKLTEHRLICWIYYRRSEVELARQKEEHIHNWAHFA